MGQFGGEISVAEVVSVDEGTAIFLKWKDYEYILDLYFIFFPFNTPINFWPKRSYGPFKGLKKGQSS